MIQTYQLQYPQLTKQERKFGGTSRKNWGYCRWAELIGVLPSKPTQARLDWVYWVLGRARPGSKAFEHFDLLLVELPVFPLTLGRFFSFQRPHRKSKIIEFINLVDSTSSKSEDIKKIVGEDEEEPGKEGASKKTAIQKTSSNDTATGSYYSGRAEGKLKREPGQ